MSEQLIKLISFEMSVIRKSLEYFFYCVALLTLILSFDESRTSLATLPFSKWIASPFRRFPLLAFSAAGSLHRRSRSARIRAARKRYIPEPYELVVKHIEETDEAIEEVPRTLLVLRSANSTIVAFTAPSEMGLLIPIGSAVVTPLVSPHIHLAVTGWAGDGRKLRRYLREVTVNHTVNFAGPPSARYLAEKASEYVSYFSRGKNFRNLACHAFILDTRQSTLKSSITNSTTTADISVELMKHHMIYEIDTLGWPRAVVGGVAGKKRAVTMKKLEDALSKRAGGDDPDSILAELGKMSDDDAQTLIMEIMKDLVKKNDDLEGDGSDDVRESKIAVSTLVSRPSEQVIRFLVFPHLHGI